MSAAIALVDAEPLIAADAEAVAGGAGAGAAPIPAPAPAAGAGVRSMRELRALALAQLRGHVVPGLVIR